ncbi:hypothetical protein QJS04_geneDACA001290 [Acorus gramineus]|uniref:DDB1-and CUL4-associated factor 8 n=1 Tax=Acorus gramineus TaxID=55184 RepID=A0AAV9AAW1_ACOGR|nr:hypothetical protein QJS04_geneDACA001290 [Acorus gramineus]
MLSRSSEGNRTAGRRIFDIWRREVGDLPPRAFAHRVWASKDLVLRLGVYRKLDKHRGCVNTVNFNEAGDVLVSGSDDRLVKLWNWDIGVVRLSFHSGHTDNVFQARIMPYTDDSTIITSAADGEVRYAQIREGGKVDTTLLAVHNGRVHKLAIEPGSPHIFYSCGEDGLVHHFDLRTQSATQLLSCHSFGFKTSYMQVVHLNAIAIDPRNPNLFVIGGSDEYARLYDIRKYELDGSSNHDRPVDCFCPCHLIGDKEVGITGLAFSDHSELLLSYNDESIYLFQRGLGLGPDPVPASPKSSNAEAGNSFDPDTPTQVVMDADETPSPQVYTGHRNAETVKGVGFFGPNCEYVVSGSDCGNIFIWEKRGGELLRVMEADRRVVNSIESHPHTTLLASSGIENNIKIWTPNAREPAPPVNLEEVLLPHQFGCFPIDSDDDSDQFIDYHDSDDDSDDNNDDDEDDDTDSENDFHGNERQR